jgi:ribosome biogenesis GTPase
MDLSSLGYDAFFAQAYAPFEAPGRAPARVGAEYQHVYRLYLATGEVEARIAGRLRHTAAGRQDYPAVGDWVAVEDRDGRHVIHAVLPRKTKFSRKVAGRTVEEQVLAANVDVAFLMTGLDRDFNPRRIERYLVMVWESGAQPVVLLNKADRCVDVAERVAEMGRAAPGIPIYAISARLGEGLDALAPFLGTGRTAAVLGSSGVGKSTLINQLAGTELQRTSEVREDDQRGRHTTRHRELIVLPQGGLLIDTPGMRELQLWDAGEGLQGAFGDIDALAADCYFSDCTHETEPRCAVKLAVDDGRLPAERLENFQKLHRELKRRSEAEPYQARTARKKTASLHKNASRHKPRE